MKKLLLLAAGFAGLTLNAIVVENSANAQVRPGLTESLIPSFEVADGDHRKLVVAISAELGFGSYARVAYGSQSFTRAVSTRSVDLDTLRFAEIWYLDDPNVGTGDIVVDFFNALNEPIDWRAYIGAVSMTGAAPGGPTASLVDISFRDSDRTKATVEFASADPDSFITGNYTSNNVFPYPAVPDLMTELYSGSSGSSTGSAGYVVLPGTDPVDWTWDHASAEVPALSNDLPNNAVAMAAFSPIPEPAVTALWVGIGGFLLALLVRRKTN